MSLQHENGVSYVLYLPFKGTESKYLYVPHCHIQEEDSTSCDSVKRKKPRENPISGSLTRPAIKEGRVGKTIPRNGAKEDSITLLACRLGRLRALAFVALRLAGWFAPVLETGNRVTCRTPTAENSIVYGVWKAKKKKKKTIHGDDEGDEGLDEGKGPSKKKERT